MTQPLVLRLLDNAFDYLLSSAEHVRMGDARHYKYAVVHLATGIELLLKARLRHEHWSLLFADANRANVAALQSGEFRSVDFGGALKRLRNVASIAISKKQREHLERLRKERNKAVHYEFSIDEVRVKSLVAQGYNIALDFYDQKLGPLETVAPTLLDTIHENLREFQEFVTVRLKAIAEDVRDGQDIDECPRCWQETLVIGNGDPHCPFCQYTISAQELAEMKNELADLEVCPSCGEQTCCLILYNNEDSGWYCTSCGVGSADYSRCIRCNRLVSDPGTFCDDCDRYIRDRD